MLAPESTAREHTGVLRKARRRLFRSAAVLAPAAVVLTVVSTTPVERPPAVALFPGPPAEDDATAVRLQAMTELDTRLQRYDGRASAAILDMNGEVLYENDPSRYELASLSKVYILVTYLDLLEREEREANHWERKMMTVMIEESDNRSASDLWRELGGVEAVQAFLSSRNLETIDPPEVPEEWGEMRASAHQVGVFLRELYYGRLLDAGHTQLALQLLGNIIGEQAWGVGSVPQGGGSGKTYVKNGWYPEEWGWTVNSAGIVASQGGSYVVVVLTDSQPSLEEGIAFIEQTIDIFEAGLLTGGRRGPPAPPRTPQSEGSLAEPVP